MGGGSIQVPDFISLFWKPRIWFMKFLLFTLLFVALVVPAFGAEFVDNQSHDHDLEAADIIEQSTPLGLPSGWKRPAVQEGIAYFIFEFPFKLERYDMLARSWLPQIFFEYSPRSMAVDESGLYVAFTNGLFRFDLDGKNKEQIVGIPGEIEEILAYQQLLLVSDGDELQSYYKTGGAIIDSDTLSFRRGIGYSIDSSTGRVFGRSTGSSPSDISFGELASDGEITPLGDSPYHGDFPGAEWTQVIQNGLAVVDSSGTIYNQEDLTYRGSLGDPIQGLANFGTEILTLQNGNIHRFSSLFLQLGSVPAQSFAESIAVHNGLVFQFGEVDGNPIAMPQAIADIVDAPSHPVLPPVDGGFTASEISFVKTGQLVFLEPGNNAIHRFDLNSFEYGSSSGLPLTPTHMGVDEVSGIIAVTYSSGRVGHVPADSGEEYHFVSQPFTPQGVAVVDGYTMICDASGAWESHWYYSSIGTLTDWKEWNHCSRAWTWSEGTRRLYFFRDGTSPNDLHWEQVSSSGIVINEGESPLHGGLGIQPPIRVQPNDAYIVLGSGDILDGSNLSLLGSLPIAPVDVTWLAGTQYTLTQHNASTGKSILIRWTQSFTNGGEVELAGNPKALVAFAGVLYAVTELAGRTHIIPVSANLDSLDLATSIVTPEQQFAPGQATSYLVEFINHGSVAADVNITIDQSVEFLNSAWSCEDSDGFYFCGNGDSLFETRNLQPGEWVRVTVSGGFPHQTIDIEASILPVSESDIEIRNNVAQGELQLSEVIYSSGFE